MPGPPQLSAIAISILLTVGMSSPSTVQLQEKIQLHDDGAAIIVEWVMQREEGVQHYLLSRRTSASGGEFVPVTDQTIRPLGAGRRYRVRDTQVFKDAAESVTYRLEARLASGHVMLLSEENTTYTSTAVRRTWGSIKAMFQ